MLVSALPSKRMFTTCPVNSTTSDNKAEKSKNGLAFIAILSRYLETQGRFEFHKTELACDKPALKIRDLGSYSHSLVLFVLRDNKVLFKGARGWGGG